MSKKSTVHRRFESHAAQEPRRLALVSAKGARLTYGELDRRANRVARRLRALGVGPETVVAVCLPRSPEMVIAELGVLKAGGAYLPIDPASPPERLAYVLSDSGARLLLASAGLPEVPLRLLVIDGDGGDPFPEESGEPVPDLAGPDHLAYVIYTSGSTGRPKGTEMRHAGLSNLAAWHRDTYDVRPEDRASLAAGPGFDASVWEVWGCLTAGASLHVAAPEILASPAALLAWMAERRITLSFLPTPLAEAVLAEPKPEGLALRALLTGGDRLLRRPPSGFTLVNHYGPTESTVVATWSPVAPEGEGLPGIGRPIAGTRVHLVDRELRPVPPGEPGELCIAGIGLARGYLRRPDLTAERFVPDPFGGEGDRLYRSGDLARLQPDGNLGFLGRIDHQVKIRGFRIELGEVEATLAAHPDVREAAAVVREEEPGDRRLVAYVVGSLPSRRALRAFLQERLPEPMIPSAFVFLDSLPKTTSGKVDRLALPAPGRERPGTEDSYVAPRNEAEVRLAGLWAEVLGFERVGVEDSFFELGGHSLLATRIASRMRDAFGVELPPGALYESPTVGALAGRIANPGPAGEPEIVPVPRTGDMPPSFAQERLWFLDQLQPGSPVYNIFAGAHLAGRLDVPALASALRGIVRRHEALRTTLPAVDGRPVQRISPEARLDLPVIDLGALPEEQRQGEERRLEREEGRRPFVLARGPLLRTTLLRLGPRLGDTGHVLLLAAHHIVTDGWSMEVLLRELGALYRASSLSPLPPLPVQYADFAVWQRTWLRGATLKSQLDWWRRELAGAPALTEIPSDRPRPPVQSFRGRLLRTSIPSGLTLGLEVLARREGASLFMVLLAGLFALIHRSAPEGVGDMVVGSPLANRNRSETEGLIGFFVNTLPLRARPSAAMPFRTLLARVRETALGAYARQDVPFDRIVEHVQAPRSLSHNPLFQVLFVLQNATEGTLDLPGVALEMLEPWSETAKLDMSLSAAGEAGGGLVLMAEYATDLFEEATVARLLDHLRALLERAAREPELPLAGLPLFAAPERAQVAAGPALEERVAGRVEHVAALRSRLSDRQKAVLAKLRSRQVAPAAPTIPRRAGVDPAPLSFAQERLWFLDRMEGGGSSYSLPALLRLTGRLDVAALAAALSAISRRHEALRTTFGEESGRPVQLVGPPSPQPLPVIDLRALSEARREAEARRLSVRESTRSFDLARGPLLRTLLLRLSGDDWWLHVNMHHIVSDGWSIGVLVGESAELYTARAEERAPRLPELPVQYADFALWQRGWLQGEVLEKQLRYWREELAGSPSLLELPTDRPRPPVQSYRGSSDPVSFPAELAVPLAALARAEGATLFMAVLAGMQALLHRYTGQEDVPVGSPVANRARPEVAGLIGFFVNTLVLRGRVSGELGFRQLLVRVKETALGAYAHPDLPFEKLVEELGVERSLAHTPLFQVMLAWQNTPEEVLALPGATLAPLRVHNGTSIFDLTLTCWEREGDRLDGELEYADALFDPETAGRIFGHLRVMLEAAVADPERPLADLPVMGEAERHQVLTVWNDTEVEVPGLCLHELIEAQTGRTPEAVAVIGDGGERWTYTELDERSRRIAARLRSLGVGPEVPVGVALRRSPRLVAALLGVLRAGGCYVPLDPGYPKERLSFLLGDTGAPVILTESGLLEDLEGAYRVLLDCEELPEAPVEPSRVLPGNLAYLIYTSGSTGRPKGVAIEHRSAVAFAFWAREVFTPEELSGVFAATSVNFDLSVFEIFVPLCWGGRVIVGESALALSGHPAAGEVRLLNTVPSAMAELARMGAVPGTVRTVNLAGEPLRRSLVREIEALGTVERLLNLYGPSEDTTYSTWTLVPSGEREPTIGRPVAGTRVYLADRSFRPVPVGVAGELCLGGAGLARGYLGRPELTAERFVPDPFAGDGARLYRTGDLARYLRDGQIEYLGRIDHQVKVRGFRIELGEVEAALLGHPEVREAAVLALGGAGDAGDRKLVAFVAPSAPDLRVFLAERLPDYMIPSSFVVLDTLPLTPNGKVDRKALARIAPAGAGSSSFVAPRTPAEEWLAGIWSELLGVERVGRHDSFFDLGGHSLLAVRVVSRVRDAFGTELPLRALFESPRLAELAARIGGGGAALKAPPLRRRAAGGPPPLSFGQERLWFLDRLDPGSPAYNISGAVRLAGRLDVSALASSLNGIVRRHEALRTVFPTGPQGVFQEIADVLRIPLPVADLAGLPPERRAAESRRLAEEQAHRPMDLARGPLLRTLLLRIAAEEHVFALTVHHIVADGWSFGVLVGELAALYGGKPVPELPVQYADFAAWQREWLRGEVLAAELAWWKDRLASAPGFLALPADRPRPPVQRFRGGSQRARLSAGLERDIQALARREGGTPFMVLLAALDALLARYTGQRDLVVGTPVAGRDRAETEGLIGLFLNTLALRVDLSGDPGFRRLLGRVREATLEAYAHSGLPFEKLVEELAPERDLSHAPIFQVLLVLQNTPAEPFELPGLTLAPVEGDSATSKFDLVLNATETGDGVSLFWMFNRDLFDASRIARLRGHFATLLEAAVADPEARLSELPLLSRAERQQLLEWNATGNSWAPEPSLPELIAAQVERAPDAVALVFGEETLTYAELWDRAGALAGRLVELGVGLDDLVGICAERSPEMVVGLLGILRAGAAYVPIDPGYPADRVAFMLEDSAVSVLLTQSHLVDGLPPLGARVVLLDGDLDVDAAPLGRPIDADSLAYMIYTSGSTGRPKGAMNSHRAIRNRLLWMQEAYGLTPDDRVLQKTPFSFDVSVWEFFWPLMVGARLVVARPGGHQDPAYLAETVIREGITTLHFVPSMLRVFLEAPGAERCTGLKRVICSGEALPSDLEQRFFESFGGMGGVELYNLYGPTEAAVDVTAWACEGDRSPVPIGRPIANTAVHILDSSFHEVPVGVPGELLIGGVQPARGYHRRPELTAEKFVPDPFGGAGARLYRTGDLTRWRPDGAIEYLGRIDFQVKIRGFRIELGEIEAALAAHPAVRDVVVVARERTPGDWRLVAYVVGDEVPFQSYLAERLPEYMIPSAFVFLPAMPLSPNGKVDRKALPEPDALPVSDRERVEPRTPLERFLAGLWSETLGVESVGIHDSFFELGGNSITGAVLINRLQRELGEIVHVVVIFDAPSVAQMAAYLAREHRDTVVRLWGAESVGATEDKTQEIGWVDAAALADFRDLVQPLPPVEAGAKNPPAVFVLSPPRSGSTLLRVMLGGHPALFSPPELELLSFNTMGERAAAFPGRDSFWLEGAIRAVMEARGCGPDEAKALVGAAEREDWSTQRFYRWLQESLDGRVLVDKTPSYALDAAILRRAEESFVDARYIHLIRHPYGMIRSFEEAKLDQLFFRHPHRFSRRALAELIWLASHQNVTEFLADIPAERQHWVRFEDLVRDPEGGLRKVCAFLGIEYHADMADPYKGTRMTDGIHAEGRMLGDVKFHQHRGVEAGAADRWRVLAAEHALGEITWETAVALGYERLPARGLTPIVPQVLEPGIALPLSFAQERLWFLDQLEPGSPLYNIPVALRLLGDLDEAALERSLAGVVRRHAVLRTTFAEGPVQIVHEPPPLRMRRVDLSLLPGMEAELLKLAREEVLRPFDLARGPLLRVTLVRLGPAEHAVLITMHHIVSDGWSIGVLVREAVALYTSAPLPELPVQYADFAAWQREWLRGEALEDQLAYWRRELEGAPTVLELPADRPRPAMQSFQGGSVPLAIPAGLAARLQAVSRRQGATLFMALLAAFQALLHRDSGQEDVLVGSPVAGRTRAELEGLIGFFVNMLVLRGRFEGRPSFSGLLDRVRTAALGAYAHQDLPFERLVEALEVERSLSHNPLFQASFALQNAPLGEIEVPGLRLAPVELEGATAKFDLSLVLRETAGGLEGEIEHATDLFDVTTVRRLARRFLVLLESVAAEPGRPLADLPLLPEAERHQLLGEWAGFAGVEVPEPVHRQFEAQAARTPGAVAVEHEGRRLTYRELDRLANGIASRLREQGVGPEARVGLRVERSPGMFAAILGIWKAGGAYVPLDPSLPEARLAYMLEDSGASVVLAREDIEDSEGMDMAVGAQHAAPSNLAYLIYTSGTTGQPKAVLVEHGSLAHTLRATREAFAFSADDRMPCLAPFSFDIFLFELLGPLLSGGTVVLFGLRPTLDVPALVESLGGMTLLHAVPALMRQVVEQVRSRGGCRSMRRVFVGGDAVPPDLLMDLREAFPEARTTVLYGPTEATILCSRYEADGSEDRNLLGRPLPGAVLWVMDPAGMPVPIGVPGELWIGGPGVARGYLNREELTADRFVERGGLRWYRSGDLARWLADGNLEFLGRIDQQVKVRGFRIELGEIEAVLAEHPEVRQAVVLALGSGEDRRLAAYVVAMEPLPAEVLRETVAARLPEYMMPSGWVFLDELPVTSHGKVDRRALERLEPVEAGEKDWLAPRTPTEELLASAWGELLGRDRVGLWDDFFELGGHSLLAGRMVSRVRDLFGVELPLRAVFEEPVLADLAARIERGRGSGLQAAPAIERREPGAPVPLSFAQERLWFLDRLEPGAAAYGIVIALRVRGELRPEGLQEALNGIVRRHEALRTTFVAGPEGAPRQEIAPALRLSMPVIDLGECRSREPEALRLFRAEAARGFDLQAGPLLRPFLLRLDREEHWLLLNLHHIVADGWSAGVLVSEIAALYQGLSLPELPVQYGDYSVWQRRWLSGEVLEAQIAWWKESLAGAPTVLELPTDRPRPPVQSFRGAHRTVTLPASLGAALRDLGRRQGATLFMTLLAGFDVLLHRYTGQEDVLVGSPIANRSRAELEGLVGLFVNTLVLRGRLSSEPTFRELLDRVRGEALGAYAHQDLPFERLVEELRIERSLARAPLHQVVFALQNNPSEPVALPGLTLEPLGTESGTAKTDLLLSLGEDGEGLTGAWEYSTDLFDAPTIDRLSSHLRLLLEAAAADPEVRIGDLALLSETERNQLLVQWNDTRRQTVGGCLHHLFERWVARTPDAVAVTFEGGREGKREGERLTYAELDGRAELLARRLRALGVGPEVLVGIGDNEGIDRLVAVLATFKAGGAYLPLDPGHPAERLAFVLEDARVRVLLTRSSLAGMVGTLPAGLDVEVMLLDSQATEDTKDKRDDCDEAGPDNLAYVIYTSGSTGPPNGVLVPHRCATHLILQAIEHFEVGPGSRVLQSVSFSFDASVLETWMALGSGATLCIATRESRLSGDALAELIRAEKITTAVLTPPTLGMLPVDGVPSLRVASVGGDRCPAELASRWAPPASGLQRLLNCCGPTETTIYATVAFCRGVYRREPPIGRPLANTRAYVLDMRGQAVPVGVPGELYLGGDGVARGYLARPGLTAERYVPDPFARSAGGRLYRTGDLVRVLPDGNLDFLGRVDSQVKIRGLRIEVGEVEAALDSHPDVAECVVLEREDARGERMLAAFVVLNKGVEMPDLREHLWTRLPDYMVPASFFALDSLPISPTGKVNRGVLRRLDLTTLAADIQGERMEPRDVVELELVRIWSEVLGLPRIGVRDNFFVLGGHSLLAVRLVERVRQRFGRDLRLAVLFQGGTVEEMAALLRDDSAANVSCLVPIQPAGTRPPFFCVHPAGGDVLGFAALARSLGPDQPFYGLQSRGIAGNIAGDIAGGGEEPLTRIEDMAALYLQEIRKVQPSGPYLLGGWSLGALIAFEMSRQLQGAGEEVALLAVLDSSPEMPGTGAAGEDHVSALLEIGRYVERLWGKPVGLAREELEGLDADAGLELLLERLRAADFLPPGAGVGQLRRILKVYQANTLAARRYVPAFYPGRVTLFRAANALAPPSPPGITGRPSDLGWGRVSGEPVEIHTVPGDHITILKEPNVQELAQSLRAALKRVCAESAVVA